MIISFDPGGFSPTNKPNTGIVIADSVNYATREFDIVGRYVLRFDQRANIYTILTTHRDQWEAVIIEDFKLDPNRAQVQSWSRFEAVKVIERITVYCEQLHIDRLITMQAPGLRLSAAPPSGVHRDVLQHGEYRHLEAAYRHLRYYIFMQKRKATA